MQVQAASMQVRYVIDARTCATFARRRARDLGYASFAAAEISTCASELATNLARHGRGGMLEVLVGPTYLTLRATDRGPGSARALAELLSRIRAGSNEPASMHGLGVLVRWMDEVEVVDRELGGLDMRTHRKLPSHASSR